MNKTERTKLKKKGKRLYWTAYLMGFGAVALLVLVLTVRPFGDLLRSGFNHENFGIQMLSVAAIIIPIFIPLFGSLIVTSYATLMFNKLYEWRREINDQRNKNHMKLFWEAIKQKDYEEAKRLYNANGLIWGSERVLCNGILIGVASENGMDKDWKETADQRMNSYF